MLDLRGERRISMDIAEISLANMQATTMNAVGFAVLDMSMEAVEETEILW